MDSLSRVRLLRRLGLAFTVTAMAALLAYSVFRPDPEEQEVARLKGLALSESGPRDESARREFHAAVERLSPATRKKLAREIIREQLHRMREQTRDWSMAQKQEQVDKMIAQVRENFAKLDDEQRAAIRTDFQSAEGKARLRDSFDFYYAEFTAEERNLLDPLVCEILGHLDAL